MRWGLLRFLGLSSGAAALVAGIADLVASSGQSATVFRTLGAQWLSADETSLNALYGWLNASGPSMLWGGFLLPILSQPGIVVFGCLAALFLALAFLFPGRERHRRWNDDDPREDPRHDDPRYDRRSHRSDCMR